MFDERVDHVRRDRIAEARVDHPRRRVRRFGRHVVLQDVVVARPRAITGVECVVDGSLLCAIRSGEADAQAAGERHYEYLLLLRGAPTPAETLQRAHELRPVERTEWQSAD